MIYSPGDIVVRAIGSGIWFFVSGALAIAFLWYVVKQRRLHPRECWSPVSLAAVSLAVFCAGSAMRAFLTWMQFTYLDRGLNPRFWVDTWPWFGASVILNIAGGAYCIWILSPEGWRLYATLGTLALAVLVPVGLAYVL